MKKRTLIFVGFIAWLSVTFNALAHNDIIGPHFGGDGTIHDNGSIQITEYPAWMSEKDRYEREKEEDRDKGNYNRGFIDGYQQCTTEQKRERKVSEVERLTEKIIEKASKEAAEKTDRELGLSR